MKMMKLRKWNVRNLFVRQLHSKYKPVPLSMQQYLEFGKHFFVHLQIMCDLIIIHSCLVSSNQNYFKDFDELTLKQLVYFITV